MLQGLEPYTLTTTLEYQSKAGIQTWVRPTSDLAVEQRIRRYAEVMVVVGMVGGGHENKLENLIHFSKNNLKHLQLALICFFKPNGWRWDFYLTLNVFFYFFIKQSILSIFKRGNKVISQESSEILLVYAHQGEKLMKQRKSDRDKLCHLNWKHLLPREI